MADDHPDAAWLHEVRAAIDAWLATSKGTPTSQVTGGGAVAVAERQLSLLHGGCPTILVPSATYGLRLALAALGVADGDEVLVPRWDWSASLAAVRSLGAVPVFAPADDRTLTIDPAAAAARRTTRTRAVVATHLFGIAADVPALRSALPGVAVLEDCAQAFGSTLDGRPVGTFGDAGVFSFGPGKRVDVGELGAVVLRDRPLAERALRLCAHPLRQRLEGVEDPDAGALTIRPHPVAAVQLVASLRADDATAVVDARNRLAVRVLLTTDLPLVGVDARRGVASAFVPVGGTGVEPGELPPGTSPSATNLMDVEALAGGRATWRRLVLVRESSRTRAVRS